MLTTIGRLAERISDVVLETPDERRNLVNETELHPIGVAIAVIVLASSIVAFATATALGISHLMEGALAITLGGPS